MDNVLLLRWFFCASVGRSVGLAEMLAHRLLQELANTADHVASMDILNGNARSYNGEALLKVESS